MELQDVQKLTNFFEPQSVFISDRNRWRCSVLRGVLRVEGIGISNAMLVLAARPELETYDYM
jgi:hypothetical protein